MKCLVTGGTGFIGSHLVRRLLEERYEVRLLDSHNPNRDDYDLFKKFGKNYRFAKCDIADKKQIKQSFFKNIDWVFHLAGKSNIVPSIEEPETYHRVNVSGTVYILEACRKAGIKKFLYTASSSCYGIPETYPTPETAPIRPQYPYALTKYLGELYALHYAQVYKLPVISLRLFNVFGPRVRSYGTYGPVISIFMAQKLKGAALTVVGTGRQRRDFTYVSDVVEAFITAAKSKVTNNFFNVGSGGTYSINEMVKIIGGRTTRIPKRPGEPDCTYADITKIRKILGWQPKVSFRDGMKRILPEIDYWKNAPVWTPKTIHSATKNWFRYLGN
ncbi:NAD-dependent dehydratase [Candidatus Gottesmanbacteria bacterium RIFCSPHIGHO2_01_FULL_42_27]|uniref:NAD-dependent dehydratase n=2 Tax=Candidatus Gottesmaniibacteriota TaxID=1752720 RepID=A0A1F6B8Z9_9BACT|nr:MAG: dehydratase-like protein [Candidatus Gottesmanbacteria bacterium GW2011_GWA2_42_18]KKS75310.1 MAG: dehydratase-like protein [Candidatus Gottesmanbacteria bacterium GW2011_GWC2_42_8]OGG09871.1 MAG: NAD-dependent dehydratase [Candidatus Gottesmanbacteria bacterium RIFCSPHIGHO2_01_FULL_42_27]OGG20579.1 MAG: NAD-dependent dehydratase [Candidatus Gottesmanbacteria bacterium RIFCSPHIGHO2_12_FULL_43_26]OGG33395.1 MAG: NAD-dependent dehydratase [Candidatus Gottesmanbacteria bacterium RIFCSPLOWO